MSQNKPTLARCGFELQNYFVSLFRTAYKHTRYRAESAYSITG